MPNYSSVPRFDRTDLLGARVRWLLDVAFASRTFRLSRESFEVTSDELGVLQYEGVIEDEIEFEEGIDLFSDSAEVVALSIGTVLPGVSVAKMVAEGHDLGSAVAELSQWIEGTKYEDRRVVLRGHFVDPEYGGDGEPINVSIQSNAFEDAGLVPLATHTITETTWPLAADAALGAAYPFVFGKQPNSGAGQTGLNQAYLVRSTANAGIGNEMLLVCSHDVQATTVNVFSDSNNAALGVSRVADGLGQYVTVIGPGLGALTFTDDDEFRVIWDQGNTGAHWNRQRTGPLSGAGDVLEHLLSLTTLEVDWGRIAAAKAYLNRFQLCGYIAEGVSPWEYITANLSPILPMSVVVGADGLYVIPWKYEATAKDIVDALDVDNDPSIERDGPVAYEGDPADLVNEFKLRYAIEGRSGDARATIVLGADRDPDDPYSAESVFCKVSQQRYGKRTEETESTVIYDDATAGLVVSWWARAKSLPTRTVTYLVGEDRAWLERGDVVALTDSELYFAGTVGLIENVAYLEDGNIRLTIRLVEDPAREFRRSGV